MSLKSCDSPDISNLSFAVKGSFLNPLSPYKSQYIEKGVMIVEDGRISSLGPNADPPLPDELEIMDFGNRIIMPGFIDTHIHIPQVNQRARFGHSLLDWLERNIYRAEAEFSDPEKAETLSSAFFKEMIRNGTTSCMAFSSVSGPATDIAFQKARETGVRAIIGKVMMDRSDAGSAPETLSQSIEQSVALAQKWNMAENGRLRYAFTPRFAPTCSRELMLAAGSAARELGCMIQSHLSENEEEVRVVLQLFPECRSYTEVYAKYGCLDKNTVMAHCIHMSDRELEIFKDSGASVSHCPSSNLYLKSGSMSLKRMQQHNIPMGLGSDVGAGPSFSICDVMKSMNFCQPFPISPQQSLYLATLGGAEILGIGEITGNFLPGKWADFIVMDLDRLQPGFTVDSIEDLIAFLIYLGHGGMVDQVFVEGRKIKG
ncbi:MAG: guanine deaminase [Candidatus Wallbacteria bacterium HGW-Wallbacteria-1]|uniref:Guanine deaminase n=1 Tax=Candidatus Wallbacteria bacterium HGW-Wallbacteria-1 TaxID=2013854 RepID=A0A2N1PR86_9BACT|nr:MAG: guanine deaminase [Candidatus Wallbacteria bacterium HGW-Wallbacteria-1]